MIEFLLQENCQMEIDRSAKLLEETTASMALPLTSSSSFWTSFASSAHLRLPPKGWHQLVSGLFPVHHVHRRHRHRRLRHHLQLRGTHPHLERCACLLVYRHHGHSRSTQTDRLQKIRISCTILKSLGRLRTIVSVVLISRSSGTHFVIDVLRRVRHK